MGLKKDIDEMIKEAESRPKQVDYNVMAELVNKLQLLNLITPEELKTIK